MNKILATLIFLITGLNCFSTEQISDLLIIDKDTFFLKTFPIEKLEFEKHPFSYGKFIIHILAVGEDIVPHGKSLTINLH